MVIYSRSPGGSTGIITAPRPVPAPTSGPVPFAGGPTVTIIKPTTTTAPVIPQPTTPRPVPIIARPIITTGPVVRTPSAPITPVSPISGSPISTSIVQPMTTPTQAGQYQTSEYIPPVPISTGSITAISSEPASTSQAIPTGTIFGFDQNTFWLLVIILVAATILMMG